MKLRYVFTILLILYVVGIIFFAITPDPNKLVPFLLNDKLMHFLEFLVLAVLLSVTFASYGIKYPEIGAFLMAVLIGILSEIIQLPVKTRSFSWLDYVTDIYGILIALIITALIRRAIKWKSSRQSS